MSGTVIDYARVSGLTDGQLDETVHEIMADRAATINNEGLEGQVEFLFSDYCNGNPHTARALIDKIVKEQQSD